MKKIVFSVAIMTYNPGKRIKKLLNSIRSQTYKDIEIVVVDGASKDKTEQIVNSVLSDRDKWLSEPDKGVYDAMNKALNLASGDFLIFMGADDYFFETTVLEKVAQSIYEQNNFESIYYGGVYMERYGKIVNKVWNNWSWIRGTMCHQCIFYPKVIYKKYQYNLKYKINADYAYNLNLWDKVQFRHIDVVVSYFSAAGLSGGLHSDKAFKKDLPSMIKQHCGTLPYLYKMLRLHLGVLLKGRKRI